ncbi:hypothetical protein [Micromonospora marina]
MGHLWADRRDPERQRPATVELHRRATVDPQEIAGLRAHRYQ